MGAVDIKNNLYQKINKLRIELINQVTEDIEKSARRNFHTFEKYASTDDPYVVVTSSVSEGRNRSIGTVTCSGSQVLFIEFGVGINNAYSKQVEHTSEGTSVSWGGKSSFRLSSNTFKWINGEAVELAPRPAGIVGLGQYGKGYGKDDLWIRPSSTGIPNLTAGESHVLKKDGSYREDVVWTTGHRPARALYRAVRTSMTRIEVASLLGGKYRD